MPLTFLAGDHDPGAAAFEPDAPSPHLARDAWRRPYRPGPWRVCLAALLLLITACLSISAVVIAMLDSPSEGGTTAVLGGLAVVFALRLLRVGIWVSARGLRRVGLLHTRTLRWRDVARISTVQQPVWWLGLPRGVQGQAVHVERRHGEPLRALLTDHSLDFLGRPEAFDRAADVLEAWAEENATDRVPGRL